MGFEKYFDLLIIFPFVLVWIGFVIFLRLKKKKSLVYLIFFTLFYAYLFKVLDYTLFQFQSLLLLKHFMPDLILQGQEAGKKMNLVPLLTLTLDDLKTSLLNILLLIPFGFGLPFITNLRMKKIVVMGALLSIVIEILQLVTGFMAKITFRIADINDVIFNTVGVAIGYSVFAILAKWMRSRNYKNIIAIIIMGAAAFYGFVVYPIGQKPVMNPGGGAGYVLSDRFDNGEGETPQSGDLCGDTGGTGQIVSQGDHTITIKRQDGVVQTIKLTDRTTIRTSAGPASESDLKIGDHVTLVVFDSETASTVLVCSISSPE